MRQRIPIRFTGVCGSLAIALALAPPAAAQRTPRAIELEEVARQALAGSDIRIDDDLLRQLSDAIAELPPEELERAAAALSPTASRGSEISYAGSAQPTDPATASVVVRQPDVPWNGVPERNDHLIERWNRRPDPDRYAAQIESALSHPEERPHTRAALPTPWTQIGAGIHHADGIHHMTGRASKLLYAYDDAQGRTVAWLSGSGGGVWKLLVVGIFAFWVPVTDGMPGSPSVGAFWVDPSDSSLPHRRHRRHLPYLGVGPLSNHQRGCELAEAHLSDVLVGLQVAVRPNEPERAAARDLDGLFRSTTRGASWSLVDGGRYTDLVQDPATAARWLAARMGTGVMVSIDGGASFDPIGGTGGTGIAAGFDRISLDVCDANPAWVYASVTDFGRVNGLYRSADSGVTWVNIDGGPEVSWGQAFHTNAIAVDPENCGRVLVGMGGFKMSQNATSASPTWTDRDGGHADFTSFYFLKRRSGGSTEVMVTNDGGLYIYDYATDAVNGTSNILGLNLTQTMQVVNALTSAYSDEDLGYLGLQDNGMIELRRDAAQKLRSFRGGDGGQVSVDPDDTDTIAFSSGAAYHRFLSTTGTGGYYVVNCSLGTEWTSSMQIDPTPGIAGKRVYSYSSPVQPSVVGDTNLVDYPLTADETLIVGRNGSGGSIYLASGSDLDDVTTALNNQFAAWSQPLEAVGKDDKLEIRSQVYGASEFIQVRSQNRGNGNGTLGFGMTFRDATGQDGEIIDKSISSSCDWRVINASTLPLSPALRINMVDQANNAADFIFYVTAWYDARLIVMDSESSPYPPSMTWVDRTPPLPAGSSRDNAFAFADRSALQPETVYYTTGWATPPKAFLSTDAGKTWHDATGNLPSIAPGAGLYELLGNPENLDQLFIATSVGVYRSDDRGATWGRYSAGLPAAPQIVGFDLVHDGVAEPFLRIGTYGRGVWERPLGLPDPLFADDFASGDSSAWSSVTP